MNVEQFQWSCGRWEPHLPPGAQGDAAQLVLVFGCIAEVQASGALEEARRAYPRAHVLGCTTAGEIQGVRVRDNTVALTAVHLEHSQVAVASCPIPSTDRSYDAGEQLVRSFAPQGLRHLFVLSEGMHVSGSELVRGICAALPAGVTVSGGFAGDGNRLQETRVWGDCGPETGVVAFGLYGERLKVGLSTTGGWDPFGPDRLITKSRHNVLYEIDGRPALALYKEYLGEYAQGLPSVGLLFPLALRVGGGENRVLRALLGVDEAEQSITFAGDVPEGVYARLMRGNIEHLIDSACAAAHAGAEALGDTAAQFSILVSCNGRRPVLKQLVEEEVEAVRDGLGGEVPMTGFYSYGEIAPVTSEGLPELHNQTMTVTCFAEV